MNKVFIGGCQRSGTTLLASLIGSSKNVLTIPEAPFKFDLINSFENNNNLNVGHLNTLISKNDRFRIWNSSCVDINDNINTIEAYFDALIECYNKTHSIKSNYELWVDHTTENLKYSVTILKYFPKAKFINIVRDGRAASASVLPLDWGPNDISECAKWWIESICHGLATEKLLNDKVLSIKYENLLTDPKNILKKVFNFLELDFDYSELSTDGFKLPKYTRKQHHKVGKGLDVKSISNWETTLTDIEIDLFQNKTGDLLTNLGYVPIKFDEIKKQSLVKKIQVRLNSVFRRYIRNKISQKRRIKKSYN
jgi:hypothetical protein